MERVFLAVVAMLGSAAFASGCTAVHATTEAPVPTTAIDMAQPLEQLPKWQPGMLDIHHIQTGRGNSAFVIMPDGTTMLIDAGALEDTWGKGLEPLKLAPPAPDGTLRPGQWIADYIGQFAPPGMKGLDYAVISHFHADHFGRAQTTSPRSARGDWVLAGLTDVAERWPIRTLIDRDYPDYAFPAPQRQTSDHSVRNYLRFVDANVAAGRMKAEKLKVASDTQIGLRTDKLRFSAFHVRNIAANGVTWTGRGQETSSLLDPRAITDQDGKFNENPLSIVLKLEYGKFDYVTGGDLTGVNEPDQPDWFNVESKVAPAVGEVDAMTLNHHGNRDATNSDWLRTLTPRVLVQQTWVSDHPGGEVVARMVSRRLWPDDRDIFATYVHPETQTAIGPWLTRNYKSLHGHVVIRVQPGGDSYDVFILDERDRSRPVIGHFGPYWSR